MKDHIDHESEGIGGYAAKQAVYDLIGQLAGIIVSLVLLGILDTYQ